MDKGQISKNWKNSKALKAGVTVLCLIGAALGWATIDEKGQVCLQVVGSGSGESKE